PPPAPAVEEAPVEVEPSPAPAPTTAPKPPEKGRSKRRGSSKRAPAPQPASSETEPITFDVTTHYQIKANVPKGTTPSVQVPTAPGSPIVVTTGASAPKDAPAPAAPTEPPAPGTPARGRRIAEVPDLPPAEEKKPDEVPVSAIEAQLSALEEAVTDEAAPSGESSVILPETETGSSAEEPIDLSTVSTTGDTRMRESSIIDMPPVGGDDPAEPLELTVLEEEAADVTREVGAQITFRPLGPQEAPVVLGALAKSYVFASIPPQQRHELLPFFVVGKAEAQQELLREGQQVRALFLVCSGDLDAAGPQVPRFTLSTGATFGMTSLKPLPSFGLSVRAKSPAAIAAIRAGDLTRLSKLFPSLNLGAHDTTLAVSIPSEASLPNPAGESSVVLPLAQSESPLEEPLDLSAVSTTGETRKQESSMEMPPLQGVDLSEPLELGAIDDETVAEITREVGALIPFKLPTPQHEPRILEAMAKSPFFAPVRAKRLHELLPFFVVGEAKAQQVILREGQPVQALFMILSGDLEAAGRSVPRFVLGSGRTFGMISTKPVPFFDLMVRARTPVELAAIRAKDLVRLADQFPGLNLKAHETTMAVSIPVRSPGRPASAGRSVPQATGPSVRLTCGEMPLRPVSPEEAHRVLTAIAHSPIFCLLKPSDYDRLLPYFSLINVKKGATILSKGGPPTALFMLVAGQARIVGETFVLGPGQCFGAISTNPPAKFGSTIEATADCILAVIRSESIRQIANKFPDLGLASDESSIHMPMESSGIESITAEPIDLDNIAVVAKQAVTRPAARLPFVPVDEDTAPGLLKALARSPLFGGLTATQRSTLVSSFRITSTTEGAEIVREGEENRALFLVVEGRVRILSRDGQGAERSLAALEAGETFGEMSILTREPAGASVRADVDSWIATLTEKQFLKLCEATPGLAATLARIIAQRLARTSADIVNDLKKGIFGRLELIPPGALVQAITVNAQTGLLVVQSGRQSFTGYFQDGQLYDASTQELEGEEAFYDFLHWTSGSFRLEPERRTGAQRRITTDTMGLLLEGMRQLDEQRHASGELPAIPAAKRSEPSSKVRIEPFALADTEAAAKALSRIPLFSGLSAEQVRGVLSLAQEMEAQRGDCVIRQGQEGKALYIAASGAYDVVRTSDQGREETIASLGPGDCFGEISVITGDRATATVVVREEGTLLVIPREELSPLLARLPALGASLARILAARLARTGRWLREEEQRVIMGRVESMSIPELVQALNVNRQSGTLVVQRASKTVEVDFIDGEIQDVRLGSLTGEIAFLILLAWTTGSFRFKPDRPETAVRTVNRDTVGLLFRGLRILERARQKHDQVA
ncbi:MAG: cyclic nucleotide-binding domain-containing protein, partial [Planctomycetes bacterium]|nr:cyclic nucleotide-binding domain-containing protein [Planctomycetota bacterium]